MKHCLISNQPAKAGSAKKGETTCYLCQIIGERKSTTFSCVDCGKGFHPDCFTLFHHPETVRKHRPELYQMAMHAMGFKQKRNKQSGVVGEWNTFSVPCCDKFMEDAAKPFSQLLVNEDNER